MTTLVAQCFKLYSNYIGTREVLEGGVGPFQDLAMWKTKENLHITFTRIYNMMIILDWHVLIYKIPNSSKF